MGAHFAIEWGSLFQARIRGLNWYSFMSFMRVSDFNKKLKLVISPAYCTSTPCSDNNDDDDDNDAKSHATVHLGLSQGSRSNRDT